MLTRRIGALVRGRTTPVQIMLASVLGAALGFLPGFGTAPGLYVALLLLLLVLSANLGLALLVFSGARLLSLLLLPVSFQVGRALLDGPTQGLFRAAINAPVLALFGFEHYVTSGGLLLGVLLGAGVGLLVVRAVARLRRRLAALHADHAAFAALSSTWWARTLAFIFLGGGHGVVDWNQLAQLRRRHPFRIAGVVVVVLVIIGLVALQSALTGPALASALRRGLQAANGATVDLADAKLDLTAGRLQLQGLALADPAALDRDLFRAQTLTADVSGLDLLRKRVHLEHVVVADARQGAPREHRGELHGWRAPSPQETPPAPETTSPSRKLDDYLRDAQLWRDRLAQAREWLQRLAPPKDDGAGAGGTLRERLEREAADSGYANVVARHLVEGAPTLLVSDLSVQGLISEALPGEILDVSAQNLSTQPWLVDGAPRLSVVARSGHLDADVGLGSAARGAGAAAGAGAGAADGDRLVFHLRALPVERIAGDLQVNGVAPLSGGTLDVSLDGHWDGVVGRIDLPLHVELHDTTLQLGGHSTPVAHFVLPIGLRGPLDDLTVRIEDEQLVSALKEAGAAELARRVDAERDKLLEKGGAKVDAALDKSLDKALGSDAGEKAKDMLGGLLGGKPKSKDKPAPAPPASKPKGGGKDG